MNENETGQLTEPAETVRDSFLVGNRHPDTHQYFEEIRDQLYGATEKRNRVQFSSRTVVSYGGAVSQREQGRQSDT